MKDMKALEKLAQKRKAQQVLEARWQRELEEFKKTLPEKARQVFKQAQPRGKRFNRTTVRKPRRWIKYMEAPGFRIETPKGHKFDIETQVTPKGKELTFYDRRTQEPLMKFVVQDIMPRGRYTIETFYYILQVEKNSKRIHTPEEALEILKELEYREIKRHDRVIDSFYDGRGLYRFTLKHKKTGKTWEVI